MSFVQNVCKIDLLSILNCKIDFEWTIVNVLSKLMKSCYSEISYSLNYNTEIQKIVENMTKSRNVIKIFTKA